MLLMKELVGTYHAFEAYFTIHIKEMGVTMTQFDILATLGNQLPTTCKQLGEKVPNKDDGRSYKIGLTKSGDKLVNRAFPELLQYLAVALGKLSKEQMDQAVKALHVVKTVLN
jgi:MarR family transcriptional regulator, 2-MHQ and catechol-resistance regulon repressor